jgi:hypothetical protein
VRRKYRNVPTVLDGQRFDSKREAKRHAELTLLQRAGQITNLQRQVTFPLVVEGKRVGSVRPDWTYTEGGKAVAEDAKGVQTQSHKIRWKLAKVLYPDWTWVLSLASRR